MGVYKNKISLELQPVFNINSMSEDGPQGPPYKRKKTADMANIP